MKKRRPPPSLLPGEACVVAGVPVAVEILHALDQQVQLDVLIDDGTTAKAGDPILKVHGPARAILTGERTVLNFLQRLTGVATVTRAFVERVKPHAAKVLDTRKTTPGYRSLEKYAVRCGGGQNHRQGLYDRVMIKDNHLAFCNEAGVTHIGDTVRLAREKYPDLEIELEVDAVDQLKRALDSNPDWVLLDNMSLEELRECVALCKGRCKTEASGGVNMNTIHDIAATGVEVISVGALTHSAPSIDLALDYL